MISREEAKKYLADKEHALRCALPHAKSGWFEETMKEIQALGVAIESLERLIPKPVRKTEERYGTPYWCPECEADQTKVHFITTDGSKPKEKVSYCWKCGQAIDWSECDD